jgi:hypothetical protein
LRGDRRHGLLWRQSLFHSRKPNRGHCGYRARPGSLRRQAVVDRQRSETRCSRRVGLASRTAGDARARDAEGRDAARRRDIGACARRACWSANRSGRAIDSLRRTNHGPRPRLRQNGARPFTGSQCSGQRFDCRTLGSSTAWQGRRRGFDRGSVPPAPQPLI